MTDTQAPSRNEVAERLIENAMRIGLIDIRKQMNAALRVERLAGRREAVEEIRAGLEAKGWREDSDDPDKWPVKLGWGSLESDLGRILDDVTGLTDDR